ncbi:hypothetical protein HELRODRAFT_187774 [Helobdella robusta]|uniref:Uncharacterized protein n=1 Tax=Helobdella robusta TaxID=6412 RepID=T1FPD2_HELRO|nr:hypothetical protein HELRODRAFT_187774 [Helobdella robusta]ESO11992.1 hypothetical protein HELRODRAFT_187774 [Helobdella robusta]
MSEAVGVFDRAVGLDPSNPDVYLHRGQVHLVMENLDMAIMDFQKSLSINDSTAIAHIHKNFSELRKALSQQDFDKAEKITLSFQDILNRFPSCADGYAFYGQALLDMKKFEEADDCFKKAIQLEPNNPNSYVHRGILRLSWKEDFEGGYKFIKKGIEIDGHSSFAYQALGTLEFQKGLIDSAIDLLEKAVDYSTSETEMIHLYSILLAAQVQHKVAARLGVSMPSLI